MMDRVKELFLYLPIYLTSHLSIYLSTYLSIYPSELLRESHQFHAAVTILHECLQKYEQLEGMMLMMSMMMMIK